MAIDPSQMMGTSAPQGVSNTQQSMPQAAAAPGDPAQQPPPGQPAQPPMQQAPKPPSLIPTDVGKLLAEALNNVKQEAADGLVKYLGNPRGSVRTTNADLLRVWRKRDPNVDPLYEKLINKKSDDEITRLTYPGRRALIRYGRRTYTEQVEFAEFMDKLDQDPRYTDLDAVEEGQEDEYIPPQSRFPSRGEESFRDDLLKQREEERIPEEEQEA